MADYEVLAPGGHARLVSDVKSYADRAGGKGTTQLADGSVTRDKLADGVTDRIDAMRDRCDPLVGNYFFNELAESTVLNADDTYTAPPKGVDVYGVSTQVQTTGKNLFNPTTVTLGKYFDVNGYLANTSNWDVSDYIEVSGTSICVSGNSTANDVYHAFYDESKTFLSTVRIDTAQPFTIPSDAKYIRVTIHKTRTNTAQVELGSTATAYEPYSGGTASPRPDWPQDINSVDSLTLHVANATKRAYFNQMRAPQDGSGSTTVNGVTYTRNDDGSITVGGTPTASSSIRIKFISRGTLIVGHKYLIKGTSPKNGGTGIYYGGISGTVTDSGNGGIWTANASVDTELRFDYRNGKVIPQTTLWPQLFDLTLMFGEGNEPATVAEFEEMYPDTYYPYNEGTWNDAPNWPVTLSLSDHSLRSLPDGTRDTLTLSYIGPSTEHEGWGVFAETLVQKVGLLEVGTFTRLLAANTYGATRAEYPVPVDQRIYTYTQTLATQDKGRCNVATSFYATYNYGQVGQFEYMNGSIYIAFDGNEIDTLEKANAWLAENPTYCLLELTTPITHDLGTIELPILPNPLTAWADGGSAQPTMSMEYEQDINIVIARLEAAIADLATA